MKNNHVKIDRTIIDDKGNKIEVVDLDAAILMAKRFMEYRHQEAEYVGFDKGLLAYWKDLLEKLLQLRNNDKINNNGTSNS